MYVKDWLGDSHVTAMTLAQRGAYIHLLCHAWQNGGKLQDDSEIVRRLCGVDAKEWGGIWPVVRARWERCEDGMLTQNRLIREYERAISVHDARVLAGLKGGRPKNQLVKQTETKRKATGNQMDTHARARQSQSQAQAQSQAQSERSDSPKTTNQNDAPSAPKRPAAARKPAKPPTGRGAQKARAIATIMERVCSSNGIAPERVKAIRALLGAITIPTYRDYPEGPLLAVRAWFREVSKPVPAFNDDNVLAWFTQEVKSQHLSVIAARETKAKEVKLRKREEERNAPMIAQIEAAERERSNG